jgi:hypothetical protein
MSHSTKRWALRVATLVLVPITLAACGDKPSPSKVQAPGAEKRADTAVREAGAAMLQDKPPVEALSAYLDGFHFYSGRMDAQMEAYHYCAVLNEEVPSSWAWSTS